MTHEFDMLERKLREFAPDSAPTELTQAALALARSRVARVETSRGVRAALPMLLAMAACALIAVLYFTFSGADEAVRQPRHTVPGDSRFAADDVEKDLRIVMPGKGDIMTVEYKGQSSGAYYEKERADDMPAYCELQTWSGLYRDTIVKAEDDAGEWAVRRAFDEAAEEEVFLYDDEGVKYGVGSQTQKWGKKAGGGNNYGALPGAGVAPYAEMEFDIVNGHCELPRECVSAEDASASCLTSANEFALLQRLSELGLPATGKSRALAADDAAGVAKTWLRFDKQSYLQAKADYVLREQALKVTVAMKKDGEQFVVSVALAGIVDVAWTDTEGKAQTRECECTMALQLTLDAGGRLKELRKTTTAPAFTGAPHKNIIGGGGAKCIAVPTVYNRAIEDIRHYEYQVD